MHGRGGAHEGGNDRVGRQSMPEAESMSVWASQQPCISKDWSSHTVRRSAKGAPPLPPPAPQIPAHLRHEDARLSIEVPHADCAVLAAREQQASSRIHAQDLAAVARKLVVR